MKNIIAIIVIIVITSASTAGAWELKSYPWSTKDKVKAGVLVGLIIADGITTHNVIQDGGFERNPLLGKYPTAERIVLHCTISAALLLAAANYLPPAWRNGLFNGAIGIELVCVGNNMIVLKWLF
jgi:hypothetical protein